MLSTLLALALAASPAFASPVLPVYELIERQDGGQCRNQSCEIATVAGSTGRTVYPYSTYPTGDTQDGDCCIIRYFPASKDAIYANRPGLQSYCASHGGDAPLDSNPPGVNEVTVPNIPSSRRDIGERAACTPNILIYAKGTLEPGALGVTIGPSLAGKLDKKLWTTVGVQYDNKLGNNYCLGLPGGVSARQVLAQQAQACPSSNIAMAGYSQGAMVVRNAIARAPSSQVARITNVITFGDPFDGAPIGQYSGPNTVYCISNDGVCNGQLDISFAHLSYGMDVQPAANILIASQKTSL